MCPAVGGPPKVQTGELNNVQPLGFTSLRSASASLADYVTPSLRARRVPLGGSSVSSRPRVSSVCQLSAGARLARESDNRLKLLDLGEQVFAFRTDVREQVFVFARGVELQAWRSTWSEA